MTRRTKAEMEIVKKNNEEFLKAQDRWKIDHNDKDWNFMWQQTYECSLNSLKKKLGGIRHDLEDLAMEVTILLMNRVKNGTKKESDYRIKSLPTCVHWGIITVVYPPQRVFEESAASRDAFIEEYTEVEEQNFYDFEDLFFTE